MHKRNYSLDTLKGIAAIFVIFIHAQFPSSIGKYIAYLGTFAVPLFFMVSGYYNAFSSKEKLQRSIVHILQLISVTYILNIVRIVIIQGFSIYDTVNYFLENIISIKHLLMWITMNTTLVSGVAWFLWALLYCYLASYVFHSFYKNKYIFYLISFF